MCPLFQVVLLSACRQCSFLKVLGSKGLLDMHVVAFRLDTKCAHSYEHHSTPQTRNFIATYDKHGLRARWQSANRKLCYYVHADNAATCIRKSNFISATNGPRATLMCKQ